MKDLHELFNTLDGRGLATLVRNGEVTPASCWKPLLSGSNRSSPA